MNNGTIDDNSTEKNAEVDTSTSAKPGDNNQFTTNSENARDYTQWWESRWFQSWEGAARRS